MAFAEALAAYPLIRVYRNRDYLRYAIGNSIFRDRIARASCWSRNPFR